MKDDRINQFIDELNQTIAPNYQIIKDIFNREYNYPELDPLRDEICKCLICGLYQAAITLTNHLLESSLKKCLAMKYAITHKGNQIELKDAFKDGIAAYDSWNLNNTINEAHNLQLITATQKELLHKFRANYRNAYSHAEAAKIFKACHPKIKIISSENISTYENFQKIASEELDTEIPIRDFLPIQGIAQAIFAQKDAVPYFIEIDNIIRDMLFQISLK